MKAQRLILPEAFVRRLAQRVLPARQATVYLLRWYGDDCAPSYSVYAIANKLGLARMTVWRECERAQERLQPLLLSEAAARQERAAARARTRGAGAAASERERCQVTVERGGNECETLTLQTEQCALTGQSPQRSNWKGRGT